MYTLQLVKLRQLLVSSFAVKMSGDCAFFGVDIGGMRKSYKDKQDAFTEKDLVSKEPFNQFRKWFEEASKEPAILEANSVCVATATKDGVPSARQMLLKGYGTDGFKLYTNYNSRKGQELADNPRVALNFYWEPLKRAVRVEGVVEKLPSCESEEYFNSRPLENQIGASLSNQSETCAGRDVLINRGIELTKEYGDGSKKLPRPEHWGGYLVIPHMIEFWQGQTDRIHDRIRFRKQTSDDKPDGVILHQGDCGWVYERLCP